MGDRAGSGSATPASLHGKTPVPIGGPRGGHQAGTAGAPRQQRGQKIPRPKLSLVGPNEGQVDPDRPGRAKSGSSVWLA